LFGSAVAAGDFDHDGFADLPAGAPGEDAGSVGEAGAVSVLYGSAGGLSTAGGQILTQDSPRVGSFAEPRDSFGLALAAADPVPASTTATTAVAPPTPGSTALRRR
jgi:hypothetical protein